MEMKRGRIVAEQKSTKNMLEKMDANGVYIVYIYIYLFIHTAYISLHTFTTSPCEVSLLKTPHSSFPPTGLCG